ncbi:protein of unknown function [Caminicella sporogenes DSM 14501]|uniref:DUF4830 domain-containing protein n=1 Tax=Caminicella sporogenes DSM 14501 TaxID=1121266 RepID=A0A1M6N2V6_9FIRM|nr:DUF4829 domain-containing protein [Caminicella sporogenes]SHJ90017.1 protein of unknown function [Caminicella sporogenes DSM 14501]
MNRKICFFIICIIFSLIVAGCEVQKVEKREMPLENFDESQYRNGELNIEKLLKNVEKLEILCRDKKMFVSSDKRIIQSIVSMVAKSKESNTEEMVERCGQYKDNKILLYKVNGEVKELLYDYDYVQEVGYIDINGKKLAPSFDLFRYIDNLLRYENYDTNIEAKVNELFNKYNWTVDYKINTLTETLPDNLKHQAGEFPIKIYWAYNNELSKEIGLDFSKYLGKTIKVEIYRLREPLPEFLKPRMDARGIILKYQDKIIGAYIDAGRHDSFACSLNRKSIEDITNMEWDDWIKNYIDYNDELDIYLSKKEPEEIIEEYFKALNEHDKKMIYACMTRKSLCKYLSSNMDNHKLFNDGFSDNNIKSVKLKKIKKMEGEFIPEGTLEYMVIVDFNFKKEITHDNGNQPRFISLKKEVEAIGWRISGIGTGP